MNKFILLIWFACTCMLSSAQWSQVDSYLIGSDSLGNFGARVAMSKNGNAVASIQRNNGGLIKVYEVSPTTLTQVGSSIIGTVGDSTRGVSLSANGTIVAVGHPRNTEQGTNSGKVVVYGLVSGSWVSVGNPIYGNGEFGYDVSLSDVGDIVAIGERFSANGTFSVYQFDGTDWAQLGSTIQGPSTNSNFGSSVDISGDGTRLVVSAPNFSGGKGMVEVYDYDGTEWVIVGSRITGSSGARLGESVSISDDKMNIVAGAPQSSFRSGYAEVYRFDGTDWVLRGSKFQGSPLDKVGVAVDITHKGDTVAIAREKIGSTPFRGAVEVYIFSNCDNDWELQGSVLGTESGGRIGNDIQISKYGRSIVVGAQLLDGTTSDEGGFGVFGIPDPDPQKLAVYGNDALIFDGSTAATSANNTFLDTAVVNNPTTDVTKSFILSNIGDRDLILDTIVFTENDSADFILSGITFPHRLCHDDSITVNVTFKPLSKFGKALPAQLDRKTTFKVISNDPNPVFDFQLEGKAAGEATVKVSYGGNVDIHGSQAGDQIIEYTMTSGGNIANSTSNADGSGTNQGVANGANTSGTMVVEPLGVLENQVWYLFYDDQSGTSYPSVLNDHSQNGTSIVTGMGRTPVTITAETEGAFTDYLFYVEAPLPTFSSTPTVENLSDTTGLPVDSFIVVDTDVIINDDNLNVLNDNNGNYNKTQLAIERVGGAVAADEFSIIEDIDFTQSGNTILYKGDTLATFSLVDQKVVLEILSKKVIPTKSIVAELVRLVNYKNATLPQIAAISLEYYYDNAQTSGVATKVLYPAPVISSNSPVVATEGDTITIGGFNFDGIDSVWFGGVSASLVEVTSSNGLIAVVGAGASGFIKVQNKWGVDSIDGFIFDNTTETPILNEPETNQSYVGTLDFDIELPESALAGSVKLTFTPSTGAPIEWILKDNATTYSFSYTESADPTVDPSVVSGSSFTYGTYTVKLEYQDALGNPVASVTHPNVIFSACATYYIVDSTVCGTFTSATGKEYTISGSYNDTLVNQFDCDSIITTNLTINEPSLTTISATACDSFERSSGVVVYNTGVYNDTLTNQGGCDSIIQTTVSINESSTTSLVAEACEQYTSPSGKVFTASGSYTDTLATQAGCDSLINISLTINTVQQTTVDTAECDNFTSPQGKLVEASGIVRDTFLSSAGCDSIVTFNVVINNSTATSVTIQSCVGYTTPSGNVLTTTGSYVDTVLSTTGCDSILNIDFTRSSTILVEESVTACDSFQASSGMVYTASTVLRDTATSSVGCDSIHVLTITINNSSFQNIDMTACNTYTSPTGKTYTSSGIYSDTLSTSAGCDSIIQTTLTINTDVTTMVEVTSCGVYTSPSGLVYESSGIYKDTVTAVSGCDSIITLDLEINEVFTTVFDEVHCDSFVNDAGTVFITSGMYKDTLIASNGCDSIVQYNVTINNSSENDLTIDACESYTSPSGKTWYTSGAYSDTLSSSAGCDSILNISLTIRMAVTIDVDTAACDAYELYTGEVIDNSQLVEDTLQTSFGCDSILLTNVVIYESYSTETFEEAVDSFISLTGQRYTESGVYMDTLETINGCDSTFILDLTITQSDPRTIAEALSPNGDGINDEWIIKDAETLSVQVKVVSTSGAVVFESNNYRNDWSGTSTSGDILPTGAYFYQVVRSGEVAEGWLYITD